MFRTFVLLLFCLFVSHHCLVFAKANMGQHAMTLWHPALFIFFLSFLVLHLASSRLLVPLLVFL